MKRVVFVLAASLLVACSSLDIEGLPTTIDLTVDRSPKPVGQAFEFTWEVTGTILLGVVLDYGDGSKPDSVALRGAQGARDRNSHSYASAGTYKVKATVVESSQVTASDSLTVEVTGG